MFMLFFLTNTELLLLDWNFHQLTHKSGEISSNLKFISLYCWQLLNPKFRCKNYVLLKCNLDQILNFMGFYNVKYVRQTLLQQSLQTISVKKDFCKLISFNHILKSDQHIFPQLTNFLEDELLFTANFYRCILISKTSSKSFFYSEYNPI